MTITAEGMTLETRLRRARAGRTVVYTDSTLSDPVVAKTAHAMLRFAHENVVAVCDNRHAGASLRAVCPQFGHLDLPIVSEQAALERAETIVVGFAPVGGLLTDAQRSFLENATRAGIYIVNGLHDFLPESAFTVNVRKFDPERQWIATGVPLTSTRVLTVGTSYSIGKMTASALLSEGLVQAGTAATWVATGQTGMMLRGEGCCMDAIPLDWISGNIEYWVSRADAEADVVIVEGQGSLFHPGFSGAAPILMHVSRPQQMVLCHRLGQQTMGAFPDALPSVERAVVAHEELARALGIESKVTGVSLDSSRVSDEEYRREARRIREVTGLPCCDPIRDTPEPLVAAVVEVRRS